MGIARPRAFPFPARSGIDGDAMQYLIYVACLLAGLALGVLAG
jgi:hypothetical protein